MSKRANSLDGKEWMKHSFSIWRDIRKGPSFYPLHQDACNAVQQSGALVLNDIIIWDRQAEYNSMLPLGYPTKFIINKVHEYLLIFRKEKAS